MDELLKSKILTKETKSPFVVNAIMQESLFIGVLLDKSYFLVQLVAFFDDD